MMLEDTAQMFAPLTADEVESAATEQAASKPAATKTPIIPVPSDAPAMQYRHPKHGAPSRVWPYHLASGELAGYAARFDFTDDDGQPAKDVLPITYCDLGNGRMAWRSRGIPDPRPLYRLPDLMARPDAWGLVVEGEKSADAAATLFPDLVATTPMHGAKSPHKTDWAPLAGRNVVIATDCDAAGAAFGDKVCELLREVGATVYRLPPELIAGREHGSKIPPGWDLADALAEGWTSERMRDLQAECDLFVPYFTADDRDELAAEAESGSPAAIRKAGVDWPFRLSSRGVERKVERENKDTGEIEVEWVWLCSCLEVLADTRNADGEDWGRLLVVIDRDGKEHKWAMPMELLAGTGEEYRKRLLSMGLVLSTNASARRWLGEYIQTARPKDKARCVNRIGWHGRAFVFPDAAVGDTAGEHVLLQTAGVLEHAFRTGGTLAGWQDNVARYAAGNSRLALSISAAFAAPLLHLTSGESGGFHLRGGSSTGKSTALVVAGSAWGGGGVKGYVRQWRATDNGLEGVAVGHCDALLCLDELSQVAPAAAGSAAYMLGNGQGKTRASRNGDARAAAEWRTLFLSSGEIGIADKLGEDGKGRRVAAGQQVRVIDIPADAGVGLGLFESIHGFASADAFARHLKAAAREHYGTAARAFLEYLTKDLEGAAEFVAEFVAEFTAAHCPAGADGQISRVCARFGMTAAAGEMASRFGVLPWPQGEALNAAARCFSDWLTVRGGIGSAEDSDAVAAVRRFIELHGNARFEPMGSLIPVDGNGHPVDVRVVNRAGFRRTDEHGGIEHIVLPEVWRTEVCAGMDASGVAKVLLKRGLLIGKGGKAQDVQRLPGFAGAVRCYRLTAGILSDGGDHA